MEEKAVVGIVMGSMSDYEGNVSFTCETLESFGIPYEKIVLSAHRTPDETIEYADAITRVALPYGVAAQFFQEAMDNFQAENYRAKYISALNDARRLSFVPIVDVYGGC